MILITEVGLVILLSVIVFLLCLCVFLIWQGGRLNKKLKQARRNKHRHMAQDFDFIP